MLPSPFHWIDNCPSVSMLQTNYYLLLGLSIATTTSKIHPISDQLSSNFANLTGYYCPQIKRLYPSIIPLYNLQPSTSYNTNQQQNYRKPTTTTNCFLRITRVSGVRSTWVAWIDSLSTILLPNPFTESFYRILLPTLWK
jgi:hypothetical protein